MKLTHVLWVLLAFLWLPARSAEYQVTCNSRLELASQGCTVRLRGPIVPGDAEKLRQLIREKLFGEWTYQTLVLDSPGGDVSEAVLIAGIVRTALLETATIRLSDNFDSSDPGMYRCASACFLIWVAGTNRTSHSDVVKGIGNVGLGLHRPFFSADAYKASPSKIAEAHQAMTASVREYLRREQIPERYVELMLERSSKEVYWLHESGDPSPLDGLAPWFEEMMIASCKYDPMYDRSSQARAVALTQQGKRVEADADFSAYMSWRQRYNACLYDARRRAQAAMR